MAPSSTPTRLLQPAAVLAAVAHAFDVPTEILADPRPRRIPLFAREAAAILLAELADLGWAEIGDRIGGWPAELVGQAIEQKARLLLDPAWAGLYADAVEDLTGQRPAEPPRLMAYQGRPVWVLDSQPRSVLLEFIGRPPPGFSQTTRINRGILQPAPDLGVVTEALETFLFWARPVIESDKAWPDLIAQTQLAESALTLLSPGGRLPAEGPAGRPETNAGRPPTSAGADQFGSPNQRD